MSKKNNSSARGVHVSPGIYAKETELTYAVKSLGITTLGVAGETLRGPAFQPMLIENWREFVDVFGGTSAEKFKATQYPKYELPYIAKSYLTESNQLQVCRVLGLSGYNAGPAWVIKAYATDNKTGKGMIVAVLRSRGDYSEFMRYTSTTNCQCSAMDYDVLTYRVGEMARTDSGSQCDSIRNFNGDAICLKPYTSIYSDGSACSSYTIGKEGSTEEDFIPVTSTMLGRFKIVGLLGETKAGEKASDIEKSPALENKKFEYAVSLNPLDKDYILKVLGTNNDDSEAPIFVEALYDVALQQLIDSDNIQGIDYKLEFIEPYMKSDYCGLAPVSGLMEKKESALSRKDVGTRVLVDMASVEDNFTCHEFDITTNKFLLDENGNINTKTVELGAICTVKQFTDANGKRHYVYATPSLESCKKLADKEYGKDVSSNEKQNYIELLTDKLHPSQDSPESTSDSGVVYQASHAYKTYIVFNDKDNKYWRLYVNQGAEDEITDVYPVTLDMNDYQSAYRYASTPWIVSNVKGDGDRIELNKLFRFHTISDGSAANLEIKVSIENIRPNEGLFDVVIRDINDSDTSVVALEKYSKCNMIPGDKNYIGYKIGSYDGVYESKSKFVTVEVNENLTTKNSVPAGFLGYPVLNVANGMPLKGNKISNIKAPVLQYNVNYNEDIKNRKQYFGLSDLVGIDADVLTFKGSAIDDTDAAFLTPGFHLDSRVNDDVSIWGENGAPKIQVDGEEGYKFDTVSINSRTSIYTETPIIATEEEMQGCIFEVPNLRKFTVCFYGGFDGWDIYRTARTNTDNFKLSKYRGYFNETSGEGSAFKRITNPETIGLNQQGLTSDWYAYLGAIRQFSNPEAVDINVFATPGIDFVNNTTLVEEVIDMIEEERADSIYVVTCPDKPSGAADYVDEMYTPEDIVAELEDTEIDSNYTCTYYPWVKYFDQDNSQYIYLPATKDVVRNMAMTDNVSYPWFAPAGLGRGDVNCVRAHYITKLSDEDELYTGRINPIKTFAQDGVKIWGQKNLQIRESQLNRIAVRRLLLRMRKLISISCLGLIFEPNDPTTKQKFLSAVTPIMDNIRANRGISDYRIEVNDTVESRERRELPCKIYFKPYNALEYIDLEFIVTPEAVSFDNI